MTLRDKLKFWILLSNYIQMVVRGTSPLSLPNALDDKLLDLKAYGDCENRNLPEGYQELEYIEGNSANQYINTGIVPTSSMEYYAKCAVLDRVSGSFPVFGARASNGGNDGVGAFVGSGTNTRIDSFFFTESGVEYRWQLDNVNAYGDIYEITFKNALQEVVKNGTSIGTKQYTPTTTCDKPLYVGNLNNGGALQAGEWTYRFYRFTITGIADMRPARRLSDGVLGMYDTIRKRFFTNAGTGSFIAGAPLTLPEGYTRIEYIEGNNNVQYINTGIVPTSSMNMYFKGQFISVDASTPTQVSFLAGARDVGGQYGFFLQLASTSVGLDWFVVNGRWTENHTRANDDIVEMKVNNSLAQIWLNGTSVGTHQYTPDDTTQYPLFLNGLNSVGQPFSNFNSINRIYRFTIDGVADFVPARRDSDGAIGMFNVLNNQFYGNAGTGTFTAGSVVAPTPAQPLDIYCNNGAIKAIRPIKYLESTGTQYIDTGVVIDQDTEIETEFQRTDLSVAAYLYGVSRSGNTSVCTAYLNTTETVVWRFSSDTTRPAANGFLDTGWHHIIQNKNGITADGNFSAYTDVINFTTGVQMPLFRGYNASTSSYTPVSIAARVKRFIIRKSGTLVRDFIPALDINNIPCMFDKVEGKCYYNAGTGQFIAGYLPAEYEELEYIQGYCSDSSDSTIKAAYIDTGIILPANANFYLKSQLASSPTTNSYLMCGTRTTVYAGSEIYVGSANTVIDWYGSAESDRLTIGVGGVAGDIYEIQGNNKTLTVFKNGSNIGSKTFNSPATPTLTFWLNSRNTNNQVTSQTAPTLGRIYRFTVAGVCDMIPARKRSNGHIGMYDLIRRQFFENAGEGQFTFGKLPILPDGYTQLDYIESTGTQYLNTGVANNQAASYDITVQATQAPETGRAFLVFGSRNSATVANITSTLTPTNACSDFGDYNSTRLNPTIDFPLHKLRFVNSATNRTITDLDTGTVYSSTSAYTGTFSGSTTLRIGQVTTGGASTWDNFVGKIFECKVYQNDVLVKYLIPAKRNSDGVVGMYDIMNDVFHTNEGTGDFEYGSEIPDSRESYYYVDGLVEKVGIRSAGNKNLFNGVFEQGGLYQGNLVVADTRIRTPDYLTFPAGTYTISCASAYEVWIEKNNTSSVNWYSSYTFTATSTDKFKIAVRSKTDPSTTVIRPDAPVNVQVEAGSTATAYVPYCDGGLAVCENLLGIGSTQDVQEILTGEVTRKVGVFVLTGEEWWEKLNFAGKSVFRAKDVIPADRYSNPENNIGLCSHFRVIPTSAGVTSAMNNLELAWNTNSLMCIRYDSMSTLNDFLAFLRSQYDAGTPVTIVYPLATASTESVAGQTLTVSAGNNTAEIIQASIDGLMLEAKYLKRM